MTFATTYQLLETRARQTPDAIAISSPERQSLTYKGLLSHVQTLAGQLNGLGFKRNDRIALVLPNGPEMTVAFVATITCATAAPLNPAFRANEFKFYLTDLKAKAVVMLADEASSVRQVASELGIVILELKPLHSAAAGMFTLETASDLAYEKSDPIYAQAEDIALISHTSGTTAKPKIVPCTQQNLMAGAALTGQSLNLDPSDRYLRIMPLSHTHGLVSTLAALSTGGTVFASPDFDPSKFFDWFNSFKPTWYSAAPTLHQAILEAAVSMKPDLPTSLRFIRSSAAALPPRVLSKLESTFGVPVIEGYGLSESALYLTNNPLGKTKLGSVGISVGSELQIMGREGELLSLGERGEIVVRGPNIISGYENNPVANANSFKDGWFRTGDLGHLDAEGYLFLTGRIKEMVNRGGQKIAPLEVDEVLKAHPEVAEAVSFAVPHPTLGEDIAAAVTLHADAVSNAMDIRKFAIARLAPFKVPSQIVVVNEIPKGPTGKLQRITLAQELADQLTSEFVHPRNWLEKQIATIWSEVLGVEQVGVNDNFFALGGQSLFAAQIATRIRRDLQLELTLNTLFETPTIGAIAELLLDKPKKDLFVPSREIKSVKANGTHASPKLAAADEDLTQKMDFSLIFFSADGTATKENKYQLFLDSVRFADSHGFRAVWTPERHFHPFGGLYPNPALLAASMATMTENIQLRAGSVVIPFHDPLRIAEDWSVIDNLSGGRVGIACASGWHTNDFVLAPDDYKDRKQIMDEHLSTIQKLWRGESITRSNGSGKPTEVRIYPDPIQPILPMWLASHSDATFIKAGELGLNVLTVLWDTDIEALSRKIDLYHKSLREYGFDPATREVALMMHTFVDDSMDVVQEKVKSAYEAYLNVNLGLQSNLIQGLDRTIDLTQDDKEFIISHATQQLFKTRGLVGTPDICIEKLKVLQAIGVTEVACLIDFGVDDTSMMRSLYKLDEVKEAYNKKQNVEPAIEEGWL